MVKPWTELTDEELAARKASWEREESEPTPLPWRVERALQWDDKPGTQIIGANDDTIADDTDYYPHAIKAADADFIVLRVNAHDALVAALEPLAALAQHYPQARKYGNRPATGSMFQVSTHGMPDAELTVEHFHNALAALALARGGK